MTKLRLVIAVFISILLGCNPQPNSVPTRVDFTPTLTARPTSLPTALPMTPAPAFAEIRWNVENITKLPGDRFSLSLDGMTAVDSRELFVYGDLQSIFEGWRRSLILKSVDQGRSWDEVFEPIDNNSVLFVSFIDQSQGWLLCAWTLEALADLKLYQTSDGGKTWTFVSKIPMWQWYGSPTRLQFLTPDYGEMDILYIGGAPGTDKISSMSTSDGGVTWSEKTSLPTVSQGISVYDAYRRSVPPRLLSFGTDDSIWIVNDRRVSDSFYELQVLRPSSAEWQSVNRIANVYTFKDGQVSITK
ncbi:MAG TPA: hypothetical protein VK249_08710 [Anaerolineales bacterium]|nr:hypothetical protein [Anaerolineales bacterium]